MKSFLSILAYRINSKDDFNDILPEIRKKADYFDKPFEHILGISGLSVYANDRKRFIAESPLSGRMCTAEGYIHEGKAEVYGIVDSICEAGRTSFARYEYPSSIPREVQFRISDIACRVIEGIGLDQSAFNIEFFWDQELNKIGLLEINPRISQSHADLFEKVHGAPHFTIMLDIAFGRKPAVLENKGEYKVAAKFMYRAFEDGFVEKAPGEKQFRQIAEVIPGTLVKTSVKAGNRLSELPFQDSYSYLLASIFIGGFDQADLLDKYHHCLQLLEFKIRPAGIH